jgi:hypothetical protein
LIYKGFSCEKQQKQGNLPAFASSIPFRRCGVKALRRLKAGKPGVIDRFEMQVFSFARLNYV